MTIPKELQSFLDVHPEIISGAVRFKGTRVPVQALIDTLDGGDGIAEFLEVYPGVSREQAEAVMHLEQAQARRVFGIELI